MKAIEPDDFLAALTATQPQAKGMRRLNKTAHPRLYQRYMQYFSSGQWSSFLADPLPAIK